eukprot:2699246-Prymnesium_polylepis.2
MQRSHEAYKLGSRRGRELENGEVQQRRLVVRAKAHGGILGGRAACGGQVGYGHVAVRPRAFQHDRKLRGPRLFVRSVQTEADGTFELVAKRHRRAEGADAQGLGEHVEGGAGDAGHMPHFPPQSAYMSLGMPRGVYIPYRGGCEYR